MQIPVIELGNDILLRQLLDAMPSYVFLVDRDVDILEYNTAAGTLLGVGRQDILRRRSGELLHCIHSTDAAEGCGRSTFCQDCPIRGAVNAAFAGNQTVRRRARMDLYSKGKTAELNLLVTATPFAYQGYRMVALILEDIGEIAELQRILPICVRCRKVRDDGDYWSNVDEYFRNHLELSFAKSLCPDCFRAEARQRPLDLPPSDSAASKRSTA